MAQGYRTSLNELATIARGFALSLLLTGACGSMARAQDSVGAVVEDRPERYFDLTDDSPRDHWDSTEVANRKARDSIQAAERAAALRFKAAERTAAERNEAAARTKAQRAAAARATKIRARWPADVAERLIARHIWIGMTAEMLRDSWGAPNHINRTITAAGASEQWKYGLGEYVYVEAGRVTSIQTSRSQ